MNNPIIKNDQWLTDGDCQLCRRLKYCSKKCNAAKRYDQRIIADMIANALTQIVFSRKPAENVERQEGER